MVPIILNHQMKFSKLYLIFIAISIVNNYKIYDNDNDHSHGNDNGNDDAQFNNNSNNSKNILDTWKKILRILLIEFLVM